MMKLNERIRQDSEEIGKSKKHADNFRDEMMAQMIAYGESVFYEGADDLDEVSQWALHLQDVRSHQRSEGREKFDRWLDAMRSIESYRRNIKKNLDERKQKREQMREVDEGMAAALAEAQKTADSIVHSARKAAVDIDELKAMTDVLPQHAGT